MVVFPTSTPYGDPYSEFRDVGTRRRIADQDGAQVTQVQLSQRWREPTPAIIHYKADISPVLEKIVRIALLLLRALRLLRVNLI